MATKRRKMWAVVDDEGRGSQVFTSLKRANRARQGGRVKKRKCSDSTACDLRMAQAELKTEHARGVAEERARIVADLRAEAKRVRGDATDWVRHAVARKLELRADRYERGDHLKEESDD